MGTLLSWPFNGGETVALALVAIVAFTIHRWLPEE